MNADAFEAYGVYSKNKLLHLPRFPKLINFVTLSLKFQFTLRTRDAPSEAPRNI